MRLSLGIRGARLIALLTATAFLSLSLSYVWLHLTSPFDGARLGPDEPFGETAWRDGGIVATPLESSLRGLQPEDLIVAVDGTSIETWVQVLATVDFPRPQWKLDQIVIYTVIRNGSRLDVPIRLRSYPLGAVLATTGTLPITLAIFLSIATYIFLRRPQEQAAIPLLMCPYSMLPAATAILFGLQISDLVGGTGFWLFKLASFGAATMGVISLLNFALIFPQPHPVLSRHRTLSLLMRIFPVAACSTYLVVMRFQTASMFAWIGLLNATWPVPILVYLGLSLITLVSGQLFGSHDAVTRQQGRLVVFSIIVMSAVGIVFGLFPKIILGHVLIDRNVLALFPLGFVGAVAVAVLRYHLFDIDIVINRTLVYGAVTAIVVVLYGLVVGSLSALFESSGNFLISLLATGLIAVIFQPLRERLQRSVNRLMYGERDDPYTMLAQLGQRLKATLTPDRVLPTIVETVAQALKLPYVAIALKQGDWLVSAATFGLLKDKPLRLPLVYQADLIGELILAPRGPGEPFSPADLRLLDGLAHQVGIAAHAVRLTADLQRSREQLVTAREEERRRLWRDLHDGLGQALASLTLQLDALRNLLPHDPAAAVPLVSDLKAETQAAITDIRRLVYELRPPALDELGLVAALREHVEQYNHADNLSVRLEAPERLPPLPAAVEVAAYRIALEAVTNVVQHANAHSCTMRLTLTDGLCLEVIDDGCGLPARRSTGVGLRSMQERAAELGGSCLIELAQTGGTRVLARLPLPQA